MVHVVLETLRGQFMGVYLYHNSSNAISKRNELLEKRTKIIGYDVQILEIKIGD